MNKTTMYIVGALVLVGGWYWYKQRQAASTPNDQGPAQQAQQYYGVPPDTAAQVDSTGGVNFPGGIPNGTTVTLAQSQQNALPVNGSPVKASK